MKTTLLKRLITIFLFSQGFVQTALAQALPAQFPDSLFTPYYHQRKSLFAKLPASSSDILFLGNSITDGGEWGELFNDERIKNRGISGDFSVGVMNRMQDLTKDNPAKIFLLIGINDLSRGISPDSIAKNIFSMVKFINEVSPATRFYVQSVLPVNPQLKKFSGHTNKSKEVLVLNRILQNNQAKLRYSFINLYDHFVDQNGFLSTEYTNDGLHLTGNGYLLWKHLVFPYVYDLPQKPSLLPAPQEISWEKGFFLLPNCKSILVKGKELDNELHLLRSILAEAGASPLQLAASKNEGPSIQLELTEKPVSNNSKESYRLSVAPSHIRIVSSSSHGIFNALQTLRQLARDKVMVPATEITDWPAFPWRGFMIDVGRNFVSVGMLKQIIEKMALTKYSVFHFHATEDIAWRFPVSKYPQLVAPANMLRNKGLYYTETDIRELMAFCKQRHIEFVPEIDMPGHSAAFQRAMHTDMQTPSGKEYVKEILDEICNKYDFNYLHIGADEVKITDTSFVPEMTQFLRQRGKQVIGWQPGGNYDLKTIRQLWLGKQLPINQHLIKMIDSRHLYLNHMDPLEAVVTLFNRQIGDRPGADSSMMGATLCLWNDRVVSREEDLLRMNPVYPGLLAFSERSWLGGGSPGWVANLTGVDSTAFNDFESRLMEMKRLHFSDDEFPYIAQRAIRWNLYGPFDNEGDLSKKFPPETSSTYLPNTAPALMAKGGTVILRHWWFPVVKGLLEKVKDSTTWYAHAKFWADQADEIDCWIGFSNFSRSYATHTASLGEWDSKGSRIWLNGKEVPAPLWKYPGRKGHLEEPLLDEGYEFRTPTRLKVQQGWNEVLLKLPVAKLSNSDSQNPVKWMFTFVPLDSKLIF